MSTFIKFFDSKGFLIALTSLDGVIKYTTQQAGQDVLFQNLSPTGVMGQNISLVLKAPQLLELCISANSASVDPSFDIHVIELETIYNTFVAAHFSPRNNSASPMDVGDYDLYPASPTTSPSSLAQAFQFQSSQFQFHDISVDMSSSDSDEEMSFNECFDDAAMECR